MKLLSKGAHGDPQTTWDIAKAIGHSPQTDSKALMLKATATHGRNCTGIRLAPSFLLASVCGTRRFSAYHQEKKVNTNPATKSLIYNGELPARCTSTKEARRL